jgi:hypothetical protein
VQWTLKYDPYQQGNTLEKVVGSHWLNLEGQKGLTNAQKPYPRDHQLNGATIE